MYIVLYLPSLYEVQIHSR